MNNLLTKLTFLLKKPPIVIIAGKGKETAAEAINKILKPKFKGVLIKQVEAEKAAGLSFFIRYSRKPVLVVTNMKKIPEAIREINTQIRKFPLKGNLILNSDDEIIRKIESEIQIPTLTFGFQERADFLASDIKENYEEKEAFSAGTNFKVNYEGNIVPFWLKNLFGKEQIYAALAAAVCGIVFGLNLVDVSQALKTYFSIPGRQRLIKGIKNTLIFDDSENADYSSMIEALEILERIEAKGKKIAVLGDVLGIGRYSIEAHEVIGERVAKIADLLFTIGPRAKFIAQGAIMKGFDKEKVFSFDEIEKAGKALQEKIKQGDLILVDGSKELKMGKIVEEIKQMNVRGPTSYPA